MTTRILNFVLVLLVVAAAFGAYRLLEASLEAQVYRERLVEMSRDYEALRDQYNQAVRRTAVTELVVDDGVLTVVIRTAAGEIQSLVTPFDPRREIYVDYVVLDGRLWIRRLFDDATAPDDGMLVDPQLVDIDWASDQAGLGKAAYRSLEPGRWVVDVTGDGSLGLSRRSQDSMVDLASPPPVRHYEPVEQEVAERLGSVHPREAVGVVLRQLDFRG